MHKKTQVFKLLCTSGWVVIKIHLSHSGHTYILKYADNKNTTTYQSFLLTGLLMYTKGVGNDIIDAQLLWGCKKLDTVAFRSIAISQKNFTSQTASMA